MNYQLPPISLLSKSPHSDQTEQEELAAREGDLITDRLDQLGMRCEIEKIDIAPQTILFSAIAAERVQVRLLPRLTAELAYELGATSVNIQAPIPGEKFIGITINNKCRRIVNLGDVIEATKSPLTIPLGIDSMNNIISHDIKIMPHCLVAGTTGSGKSNFLHTMICSLLMKTTPDELLFHLTDTKMVELPIYDGIPNLMCECVTDSYDAIEHFKALVSMMEERYKLAQEYHAKSLPELNEKLPPDHKLPYILVIVDEVADLIFLSKHDVEESITRIAGKARAVGIHMILATQSPRREVISGLLKSNLPSRLGFSTSSELDSRIIIDKNGCGSLTGNGDVYFSDQGRAPIRLQAPFIDSNEISSIVAHCRDQSIISERIAA